MKKIMLIAGMLLGMQSYGQDTLKVNPDRPDETDGTYIIRKGYLQLEQGIFFERERSDGSSIRTFGLREAALRLGVTKNMEFQVLYELEERYQEKLKTNPLGIASARVGLKYNISDQKGLLPSFAVAGNMSFPFLIKVPSRPEQTSYAAALLFQNELGNTQIGYNIGFTKAKYAPAEWLYTISLENEFNKKLTGFIEYYSSFQKEEKTEISFDGGFAYTIGNLLVVDMAAGITLTHKSYFFTVGFTYLVPWKLF